MKFLFLWLMIAAQCQAASFGFNEPRIGGTNLVLWVPMNENSSTNAFDHSGNGSSGTFAASLTWTNGIAASSLGFDGTTTNHLRIGGTSNFVSTSTPWTISVWARVANFTADQYPLILNVRTSGEAFTLAASNQSGYTGFHFGSPNNFARLYDGTPASAITNRWRCIQVTYNGASATNPTSFALYLDGVSRTLTNASTFGATSNTTTMGRAASATFIHPLTGAIDDVRIFNRQLSSEELVAIYNQRSGGK